MEILSKTEGFVLFFQDPPQVAGPELMAQMGIWEFLYQCQETFSPTMRVTKQKHRLFGSFQAVEFPSSELLKSHPDKGNGL